MKTIIFTISFIFIWVSQAASAESAYSENEQVCDKASIEAQAEFEKFDSIQAFSYQKKDGGPIISGVCKIWPFDTTITIAAFASAMSYNDGVLSISIIDNRKNVVIASYRGALVNGDTPRIRLGEDKLRIDTAHYDIAPGVIVFGLDVISTYPSELSFMGDQITVTRTLFAKQGEEIRSLFFEKGLPISIRHPVEEYVGQAIGKHGKTKPIYEDIHLYISNSKTIDKESTIGFSNLLITAVSSYSNGAKSTKKPFHIEIPYHSIDHGRVDIGSYDFWELDHKFEEWKNQ